MRAATLPTLRTARLVLEPLTLAHADEMAVTLADPRIYTWLDYGPPPSVEHLRGVYHQLEARRSPEGDEGWLNWVLRLADGGAAGFVQATVLDDGRAWVAYVLASRHWRQGLAQEAVAAMVDELRRQGVRSLMASVEVDNLASIHLLERLGFALADPARAEAEGMAPSERLYLRPLGPPGPVT